MMKGADRNFPCDISPAARSEGNDIDEALDLREILETAIVERGLGPFQARQVAKLIQGIDGVLDCELHLAPRVYSHSHLTLYQQAPAPKLVALAKVELCTAEPAVLYYLTTPEHRRLVVEDFHRLVHALAEGHTNEAIQALRAHLSRLKQAWSAEREHSK
jgi:DNA-binding FadR family transcriptional regulator